MPSNQCKGAEDPENHRRQATKLRVPLQNKTVDLRMARELF